MRADIAIRTSSSIQYENDDQLREPVWGSDDCAIACCVSGTS